MADIFISYSREDSSFVEALIVALIGFGWTVWSDKSGMVEGRPFDQQIENAIAEASVTLVIWSRPSVKSRYVRAEAAFAWEKDKLLPVIADDVDPPLQFLHIQGFSLVNWGGNTDDLNFKKLAAALSRRLDRVARIPRAENDVEVLAKANSSSSDGLLAYCRDLWGVCFPIVGPGFDQYFAKRTFYIVPAGGILGFTLITFFGLVDVLDHAGADQTFYRVVIGGPSLLILLALSFLTRLATQHSQKFALATCIVGLLLVFKCSQSIEDTFPVTTGAATTTFLVSLALFMVIPLRTLNAAIISLLVLVMHESYILWAHKPILRGLHAGYSICVLSAGMALVAVAYFRELLMRKSFLDDARATAKISELRESLMTLAAQGNHARDRSTNKPVRDKSALGRPK